MRIVRWVSGCGRVGGCPDADESVDGERCPKNMVVFVFLGFFLMCSLELRISWSYATGLVLCQIRGELFYCTGFCWGSK